VDARRCDQRGGDVCVRARAYAFAARGRTQSGPAFADKTHHAAKTREKKVRVVAASRRGPSEAAQITMAHFFF
jgi:hypothetical protein